MATERGEWINSLTACVAGCTLETVRFKERKGKMQEEKSYDLDPDPKRNLTTFSCEIALSGGVLL